MQLRPATPADAAAWQAFVARTGSGDFLHDWEWASVAAFDGQPQRRYLLEEDGEIVVILAAQTRTLPAGRQFWYVPHGPVLDYADPRAGDRLRALALALGAADRVTRVLVERCEQRLVVGELHETRVADLERLVTPSQPADVEERRRRATGLHARLQLHGDRPMKRGHLPQREGQRPDAVCGARVGVVEPK